MKALTKAFVLVLSFLAAILAPLAHATSLMENLGRGVVAVRTSGTEAFVSWRVLGTDPAGVAFNLYRSTGGGAPVLLNASPLTGATHFADTTADFTQTNAYFVRAIIGGTEQPPSASFTLPAGAPVQPYLRVPLQPPPPGMTPDGLGYGYNANDCSVGDLDGDGEYEIIVKWEPTNAQDNANEGLTGNVYLDAYKLDGTRLWRIDLGKNIRAGAHYTQFIVYDLDGDGIAELACKTADGTVDGVGNVIGDPAADWRDITPNPVSGRIGYVLRGPEFLTIFNGQTGAALATTNYVPARGNVSDWGDNYGNRVDRFLAGVAYLDGQRPSLIMCRGYYTRTAIVAWDWRGGTLTQRWVFDTGFSGGPYANYQGQGNHQLTIGDVDGDGRDEIMYGACAINDDGTGLFTTGWGHGDALHMSDMDPDRPGLEVWQPHESPSQYGPNGGEFRDARTGALIFGVQNTSTTSLDVGRGLAADIDPRYRGYEMWASAGTGGVYSAQQITPNAALGPRGVQIAPARPSINHAVWWDGDLLRELLDGTSIRKWDWTTSAEVPILAPSGIASNNGTKANPSLQADLLGDWREEVIWRESNNSALRIYVSTSPTTHRLHTLMHDRQYRLAIAWQNVAYNQPPHPSFYLGDGMTPPSAPDIVTSAAALPPAAPAVVSINRYNPAGANTGATSVIFRVAFNTYVTGVDVSDFSLTTTGTATGVISSVTPLSGAVYNVTVGSITGSGTIRLDLNATGTGIAGPGGAPIAGGFTSGQLYNRATLAWINPTSGGLWSDPANWDGGVVADGVGSVPIFGNFDLTADNTVTLDTPRTISGLTFGDTNTASAASWTISDGGNAANVLTLDVTSGLPANTVNTLGSGATATLAVSLAGSDGLAKSGAGTLVLTKPATLAGQVNVNAGTLRFAPGSALAATSVNVSSGGGTLDINGGTFSATATTTVNGAGGSLIVNAGSGTFAAVNTNNSSNGLIRVNGGAFTATSINLPRSSDGTPSFAFGFVVTGGVANVTGSIGLGTNNSWGSMSVEGGALTVGGAITVGNQASGNRGGQMRVTGGTFVSTHTAEGIVLSRRAGNVARANFSGGTSTVERFILGFNSSVNSGSATLTVDGGTLYLGAGGISASGSGTFVPTVNLRSGVLGAKAGWSTALPITLPDGGNITLKTANALDEPFDITLNGPLTGAGGFTKMGGGTLTLGAANTFTGAIALNAGALRVNGSLASGGTVNLNGGTLAGTGTIDREVVLNTATLAPDGTSAFALNGPGLTWNNGGRLAMNLGENGVSGNLTLTGALTKGTPGSYIVALNPMPGFAAGNTYTLATFASTNFTAADFTATGLPAGYAAFFNVGATRLQVTVKQIIPLALGKLRQFYDGTPKSPTAITSPAGLNVVFTYNGSPTAPTLPGAYFVVATIDDPVYTGSTTGTLVITTTAVVRHTPTIAGGIDGSAHVLLPESLTLTGDLSHDLLVPGTPTLRVNGNPLFAGVQDASGNGAPNDHTITLNGGAVLRYVVRRVDAVALPIVPAPLPPVGTRDVVLNNPNQSPGDFATLRNLTLNGGAGTVSVPPGAYGNFTANGGSSFVFGVAGATEPAVYHLQQLTLNGAARLQVVGPVIVRLGNSLVFSSTVGSAANPRWLVLQLANGGVTLNTGAVLHGEVLAPNGTVVLNDAATLNGNVASDRLIINTGGLLHDLPP